MKIFALAALIIFGLALLVLACFFTSEHTPPSFVKAGLSVGIGCLLLVAAIVVALIP